MKKLGKWDTPFKETIVELYAAGTSVQTLSEDYGIAKATIYTWIKTKQTKEVKQNRPELATEHAEMQNEIQRLKEENEILKKCISIFTEKKKS
ncbi:transposase [Listeria monocytogenes]|uniref:transposase n=1 Tax=Listeria monocytogenes TaxID=1639 RepID=UPI000A1D4B25|nr:transposase [Listeria monocytogenes]ARM72092.1 transposase [Listeria monocytogenes]